MDAVDPELRRDRDEERTQDDQRRQPLQQRADHDQQQQRSHQEHVTVVACRVQHRDEHERQVRGRQRPREGSRGRDDEQHHAGEKPAFHRDREQRLQADAAIDQAGQDDPVQDRDRRDLRRGRDAEADPHHHEDRHDQGQEGTGRGP